MAHTSKSIHEMGFESVTNMFRDSLSGGGDKPDFNEHDLGSPVSPLVTSGSINGGNVCGGAGANTSSSSSSSSGSVSGNTNSTQLNKRSDASRNHSGELSGSTETSPVDSGTHRSATTSRNWRPGHRRSASTGSPLIYSGKSFSNTSFGGSTNAVNSVSSNPTTNSLPNGNICPSGKVLKAGIAPKAANRTDVLGSGMGNYGHGSIIRGCAKLSSTGILGDGTVTGNVQFAGESMMVKRAMASSDPEEVKKAGNELYRRGNFVEALSLYDRAISLSPENAAYRSNRAAALTALGRLGDAVMECEEALRLDPGYGRAHNRLAALYIRFGQVENARSHLFYCGQPLDQSELQKLKLIEKHLNHCGDARKICDWKAALRESDAAIAAGADFCPQLVACKAEALLKLHQLDDADSTLSNVPKMENYLLSFSHTKFFGIHSEAYVLYIRARVEMALGRFENAVVMAEKAGKINYNNHVDVVKVLNSVKMVARARSQGNDLFSSGRYAEACLAYGEGLKYDNSNSVLYCNRAVCWAKLGQWENSVEDCNQAIKIQPAYKKALLRRAASNVKLERWGEAVRDYEVLRRELPGDAEVAESLRLAQVALRKSRGVELVQSIVVSEVEEVPTLDKFKAAISLPGVSVIHFKVASNEVCEELSSFMNMLCVGYPFVKFFKVDVDKCFVVAKSESIRTTPTLKIYKNGEKLIEMIRPSHQLLEDSVRSCAL